MAQKRLFLCLFLWRSNMDSTDLLMQIFQYVLGVVPGDVAGNIISIATVIVTICTLIIRFWKEPQKENKLHKLWQIFHLLASFKKSDKVVREKDNVDKVG